MKFGNSAAVRALGLAFAMSAGVAAVPAQAVTITPLSYSMPNGSGQGSGGSFNYWDLNYSGSGSTNVDGAALSGGRGDLTDGYAETLSWGSVENAGGTGPYVGWQINNAPNPLITFNFANGVTINQIDIHFDNTGNGGVSGPSSIRVDGDVVAFTPPAGVGAVSLTGLNLTGTTHTLQFFHANAWIFASEVTFTGTIAGAVPEPATWAMMIVGFGVAGGSLRRRRAKLALA